MTLRPAIGNSAITKFRSWSNQTVAANSPLIVTFLAGNLLPVDLDGVVPLCGGHLQQLKIDLVEQQG